MNNIDIKLFVMEGPAGSGKSFTIRHNLDLWTEVPRLGSLPRPRSYDGEEGIMLSQAKDALSAIAVAYQPEGTANVIDRWLLSQWVYGTIRRGEKNPSPSFGLGLIRSGISRIVSEVEERLTRSFQMKNTVVTVRLQFLILLPEVSVLKHNRQLGGKDYPYDPALELEVYTEAARKLQLMELPAEVFRSSSVPDQAMVPGRVREVIQLRLSDSED